MYSESDIEAAVSAGVMTREAAEALRANTAAARAAPAVDEESFRLITGFNDIFVTIAALLLLLAVGWIGMSIGAVPFVGPDGGDARTFLGATFVAGALCAGTAWGLAEYFTRRRRMALPSIVLLGAFVFAVGSAVTAILALGLDRPMRDHYPDVQGRTGALIFAMGALAAAGAAWLHWRRFHVPITIAALTGAMVLFVTGLFDAAVQPSQSVGLALLLLCGLAIFGFAMWWDMSDRDRVTRRSDVAFWLHLGAAPMIAHPLFWMLGVLRNDVGGATALLVILLYVAFGLVALAVDRRALLVSSLIYVLYALSTLFRQAGAISLNIALTALVIGSALLMLSAFWHVIRREVVQRLPLSLQARLPTLDRPAPIPRPA